MRARSCEDAQCNCKWRVRVIPADENIDRGSTTRELEKLHERAVGEPAALATNRISGPVTSGRVRGVGTTVKASVPTPRVVREKSKSSPVVEEESGEWREVLERVKTAMASSTLISLHPSAIRPMLGQPREFFSEVSLNNLRQSIRKVGQIQAGIVRLVSDGENGVTHELLDGERRWRAVCLEEISVYRAQLVEIDDVAAPYMIAAIANFNRDGHTPIEISDAIERLRNGPIRVPMAAIAEIFGFSEHWTYQMHGLQNLHPDVRQMLDPNQSKDRILPTTAAIHLSKLDAELQPALAQQVLNKEITVGRLRQAVITTGEVHGKPVRTREIEPRKVVSSFERRCGESSRLAGDMVSQVRELRTRRILLGQQRKALLHASIQAAIRDLGMVKSYLDQTDA